MTQCTHCLMAVCLQARVLLRLGRPVDVAERGLVFVQNFLQLLAGEEEEGSVKPLFKEVGRDVCADMPLSLRPAFCTRCGHLTLVPSVFAESTAASMPILEITNATALTLTHAALHPVLSIRAVLGVLSMHGPHPCNQRIHAAPAHAVTRHRHLRAPRRRHPLALGTFALEPLDSLEPERESGEHDGASGRRSGDGRHAPKRRRGGR